MWKVVYDFADTDNVILHDFQWNKKKKQKVDQSAATKERMKDATLKIILAKC